MRISSSVLRRPGAGIVSGAAALALAATLLAAAPSAAQQVVSLRMHTHVPAVAGSFKSLTWWTKRVEKASNGRLKITLFGSNQLGGKAEDIYDQVKNGVVDLGWTLPGYKAGLFPASEVFELPFIGGPAHIVSPAVNDYVKKWGKDEWSGVRPLIVHFAGLSVIHTKNRPIRVLADFKGMKLRTPSRISTYALSAFGATPVPIPGLKITEVIMHNVVDGAIVPWSISLSIRTIDVVKYHAETSLHGPILAMIMNKQSYAKLPADLKKAIDDNCTDAMAVEFGYRWEKDDAPGRAKAIKLKHEVYAIAPEEEARWKAAAKPAYDEWSKEMTAKGLPAAEMISDAENLVAKYRALDKAGKLPRLAN